MRISNEQFQYVNTVFTHAHQEGRDTLYEHEVYQILEGIGLSVPKFYFLKKGESVSSEILSGFTDEIIVKIVSPQIAHKQKLGGVKKVRNYEPLYVQYVLEKMEEEVLGHFSPDQKPEISGFLIVELVSFKQSIGYEILVGVKTDVSFGPVVTLSKGGDDAEFFAKYYDKANLFLPHMSYEEAKKLTYGLNIRHKFKSIGHEEYLDLIARTASLISDLARYYSTINPDKPEFTIHALDINPFVITTDNRFVAIDGNMEFEYCSKPRSDEAVLEVSHVESFFHPNGIAVIGVSADAGKYSMSREIARLLHDLKREDLYCVNTKGGETVIGGKTYPLYTSFEAIEANVDLVVYAAPGKYIPDFFAGLGQKKPKAVVLIPGIPQDITYNQFAVNLKTVVPEGIRIIGPNCMGVFYGPDERQKGVNTLFINEERMHLAVSKFSNTALLTQSGGMAISLIDKMPNAPIFKAIVSFGNKYDVKITDLVKYFKEDPAIQVICLYIEGFANGEGRIIYELMKDMKKPVVVYKSGKTDAGAKAAASHTAAMTGDYDVFEAACHQANVMLIDDIEAYHDGIKAFALLANKKVRGNRVAGVLNAGFEATVASDELGCLVPAKFSDETQKKIDAINTHGLVDTHTSILDVTPMTDDRMFADFVEAELQDEGVDTVFIGIIPHIETIKATPETCKDPDSLANLLVGLYQKYDKPMVVSVNAGEYYSHFVEVMERAGIPVYADIRSAVKSLDRYVRYHVKRAAIV